MTNKLIWGALAGKIRLYKFMVVTGYTVSCKNLYVEALTEITSEYKLIWRLFLHKVGGGGLGDRQASRENSMLR